VTKKLYKPWAAIQGVRAKTMTVAVALRTNATPTRASPTTYKMPRVSKM
jgi:hypothetical protein